MRARLVPVVAALVVLAACGGKSSPEPAPYKPSTASPTSTAAATTTAAPVRSEASAIAFVTTYFATFTKATLSGDVRALRALTAPDCKACRDQIGIIERVYRAGGGATGGGYTARDFKLRTPVTSKRVVLDGVVDFSTQTQTPSAGAKPTKTKAGPVPSRIVLTWTSRGWLVLDSALR